MTYTGKHDTWPEGLYISTQGLDVRKIIIKPGYKPLVQIGNNPWHQTKYAVYFAFDYTRICGL